MKALLSVLILLFSVIDIVSAESRFGNYEGELQFEVVEDSILDRPFFKLLEPFSFKDNEGTIWNVPKGYDKLDGASIPKGFWSMVGGPLSGFYLKASVVHDYFCDVKTRSDTDTHRVFYSAMRASNVSKFKASVMYVAVKSFGPKWTISDDRETCLDEDVECNFIPPADDIEPAVDFTRTSNARLIEIETELTRKVGAADDKSDVDLNEYLGDLDTIAAELELANR